MTDASSDAEDRREDQADEEQDDAARRSRDTGGDAPAAASIKEREAAARDETPFGDDED